MERFNPDEEDDDDFARFVEEEDWRNVVVRDDSRSALQASYGGEGKEKEAAKKEHEIFERAESMMHYNQLVQTAMEEAHREREVLLNMVRHNTGDYMRAGPSSSSPVAGPSHSRSIIVLDDDEDDVRDSRQEPRTSFFGPGRVQTCNAIYLDQDLANPEQEGWEALPTCNCNTMPYDILGETNLTPELAARFLDLAHSSVPQLVETLELYGESNVSSGCKSRLMMQLKQLFIDQSALHRGESSTQQARPSSPSPQETPRNPEPVAGPSTSRSQEPEAGPSWRPARTMLQPSQFQPQPQWASAIVNQAIPQVQPANLGTVPPPAQLPEWRLHQISQPGPRAQNIAYPSPSLPSSVDSYRDPRSRKRSLLHRMIDSQGISDSDSDSNDDFSLSILRLKKSKSGGSSRSSQAAQPRPAQPVQPPPAQPQQQPPDQRAPQGDGGNAEFPSLWPNERRRRSLQPPIQAAVLAAAHVPAPLQAAPPLVAQPEVFPAERGLVRNPEIARPQPPEAPNPGCFQNPDAPFNPIVQLERLPDDVHGVRLPREVVGRDARQAQRVVRVADWMQRDADQRLHDMMGRDLGVAAAAYAQHAEATRMQEHHNQIFMRDAERARERERERHREREATLRALYREETRAQDAARVAARQRQVDRRTADQVHQMLQSRMRRTATSRREAAADQGQLAPIPRLVLRRYYPLNDGASNSSGAGASLQTASTPAVPARPTAPAPQAPATPAPVPAAAETTAELSTAPSAAPVPAQADTGTSSTEAENPATTTTEARLECVICLDAQRQVVFRPCNHMVCCKNCSSTVTDCPVCRKKITERMTIFLS